MTGHSKDRKDGDSGTFSIVGIGPGLSGHLTAAARETIHCADTVYAAALYESFLRADGVLPPADAPTGPAVVESARDRQSALVRESLQAVRSGADVVHVSGGDPNVYGKADQLLTAVAAAEVTDINIQVLPGVTAALGGAAMLGAPLSNDFATISLSTSSRDWDEIEAKIRGATDTGFVLALYNCGRGLERTVKILRDIRDEDVPVAILEDIGRRDAGRNPAGESATISTLGSVLDDWEGESTAGTLAIVGTAETRVVRIDGDQFLVTRRGDYDIAEK